MNDVLMIGAVTDEDRRICDDPYQFSFRSRAAGDADDGVYYDRGRSGIAAAIDLWGLLGSDRGRQLQRLMGAEIEVDADERGRHLVTVPQIEKVLAHIAGLKAALDHVVDENWYVRPRFVEAVRRAAPGLIVRRRQTDGSWRDSLDETIGAALGVEWFLSRAVKLNRAVAF